MQVEMFYIHIIEHLGITQLVMDKKWKKEGKRAKKKLGRKQLHTRT